MSALLIRALPTPPEHTVILDWCCGSGAIAAALRAMAPGATLHVSDADAVAVAAVRHNVDGALVHIADRWNGVPEDVAFDWIVSNPPVHYGMQNDLSVVSALVEGFEARLRPGGMLWVVTQEYVPLGRMLALAAPVARTTTVSSDGRFTVWRTRKPAGDVLDADVEKPKRKHADDSLCNNVCERPQSHRQKRRRVVANDDCDDVHCESKVRRKSDICSSVKVAWAQAIHRALGDSDGQGIQVRKLRKSVIGEITGNGAGKQERLALKAEFEAKFAKLRSKGKVVVKEGIAQWKID